MFAHTFMMMRAGVRSDEHISDVLQRYECIVQLRSESILRRVRCSVHTLHTQTVVLRVCTIFHVV